MHEEKSEYHEHIFFDLINKYYPKDRVAFLCGEDGHLPHYLTKNCFATEYSKLGYICFVREL